MSMRRICLATVCLLAVLVADRATAAEATSGWVSTATDLATCMQIGEQAIAREGFAPTRGRTSAFGWRDLDNIIVRCIPDHALAVIFIYLHGAGDTDSMMDRLKAAYSR